MAFVGIDLGTTNSLIAAWTEAGPKLIPNALGDHLTPSAVSIDGADVLVGRAAVDRLITHPDASVASFKRFMGTDRTTMLAGKPFRPEELSSLVLASLKRNAEIYLGEPITEAIISVPAYFSDPQRKATLAAAKLAGIHAERLINEPTAAALAYGLEQKDDAQFLVFDLGGGTFDVSILDKYDEVMEVRATAGDTVLGGNDFRDLVQQMILTEHQIALDRLTPVERQRLIRTSEDVKIALSAGHEATYDIALDGKSRAGALTRAAFEQAAQALVRRLRIPLERAVADSQIRPDDIAQVVMVGGATRMPMVRALAGRLFGRLPLTHIDPDRVVALGAAVQAGLKARHKALGDVVMTDVCPYTLGIKAMNGGDTAVIVPIIERNSVVPISRSRPFSTVVDNQVQIAVQVYQGEHLTPESNILLGGVNISVPKDKAGVQSIDVRFTYDINGILELEVTAQSTGRTERKVFRNASGLTDAEIEAALKKLSHLKILPANQEENRTLIARADRIYAELLGAQREDLAALILQFRQDIEDPHPGHVERARAAFRAALDRLDIRPFDHIE